MHMVPLYFTTSFALSVYTCIGNGLYLTKHALHTCHPQNSQYATALRFLNAWLQHMHAPLLALVLWGTGLHTEKIGSCSPWYSCFLPLMRNVFESSSIWSIIKRDCGSSWVLSLRAFSTPELKAWWKERSSLNKLGIVPRTDMLCCWARAVTGTMLWLMRLEEERPRLVVSNIDSD